MLAEPYQSLSERLSAEIPQARLITDPLRTLAYGTDASFYRLIPELIVKVEDESETLAVIKACRELNIAITYRAAGTSLSGQALSEAVLVVLGPEGWRNYHISEDQSEITLGAGILGAEANRYLAPFSKKIGPDPASINSAKIGGIVSNNACGMASGITGNSMGTVSGMRIIFCDGTVLDTREEDSQNVFLSQKKDMVDRISALARSLKNDPAIVERIRRKYEIKNTTGYSVSALVNFDDPIDIILHLMIGSEGTLGFISEVTFRTLAEPGQKATGLMLFPDIARACEAVLLLKECRVSAAELMDRVSLRSVQDKPGMPPYIKSLADSVTALLVETAADDSTTLQSQVDEIIAKFSDFPMAREFSFTTQPDQQAALWDIRKGLFPSVCFARKKGTTVIIEDIAVPIDSLRDCLLDLQDLFQQYTYKNTIIWGHVFDGNVHFVLTPDLSDVTEIEKYKAFMDELACLVVDKYDGSLKAEHGTGRNMAPFVKREWGDRIYGAMREIKAIFDPDHMLNPGVIINDDPDAHAKNIKPMPPAHDLVDTCTECGFCERNCMSHGFTLSARQRIVIYREMIRLAASDENPGRLEQLREQYKWYGDQTCATDGLCALTCPVEIDTGKLIKVLRHDQLTPTTRRVAVQVAKRMDSVTAFTRFGLNWLNRMHGLLGTRGMTAFTAWLRSLSGDRLPQWTPAMPKGGSASSWHAYGSDRAEKIVYFPACINRSMGPARASQKLSLTRVTESLLKKAGYSIIYPAAMDKLCCGMPFASKGITETAERKARELSDALLGVSENGRIPILCDMSPCLYHMQETLDSCLQLFEPIEFTLKFLADRLEFRQIPETVAIHTVCSAKKMGLEAEFQRLAEMCANKVVAPDIICCGFAGDRGFTVPELNAFGLRRLKPQLAPDVRVGYSTSRTCEIGLTCHSGIDYQSILYLVDRCSRAKN
ncbi:Predicted D-lactate dehydrogenase, Fe-S protein, FAD/FMN-containing [Olavius sp. associated proteobacterium Delta 1]|nr:Predicted D-lactate dehydrogenase, Fe-S protein, FAD/FMN-containing [Olavius sp. associated proteobacterium Delta 1]